MKSHPYYKADRRLSVCVRCGTDVVLLAGIKSGQPAWLMYDEDEPVQHRMTCKKRGRVA